MAKFREERDSMGTIKVPKDRLWGAQTQRSIKYFRIGTDLMPREMIPAYAIEKKACALVNYAQGDLSKEKKDLIVKVCDEILSGKLNDHFPLNVWMTGSGTQFNMNINEVVSNRCSQLRNSALGSKKPVHPNDDVNMSQSSNDSFPTVMHMAVVFEMHTQLIPAVEHLKKSIHAKSLAWKSIVKLGRTHLQDATPLTLGQEFSGYASYLENDLERIKETLKGVYALTLGGTAIGTGINTRKGFDKAVVTQIAKLTKFPFVVVKNKFAAQGAHSALVHLSGSLKALATSLFKIASDIRLLSCGPRAGISELILPSNEPGSSIMPGKVNPTQCEALTMVALQVIANDLAVSLGSASGDLEMNVYKPLIISNLLQSIRLLSDGCRHFDKYLIQGIKPNLKKIKADLNKSLMLVTALTPLIGYDKASALAHYAMEKDLSLKEAALTLGYITEKEFDKYIDPLKMCSPS